MFRGPGGVIFLLAWLLAAAFLWQSTRQLPDPVASHFGGAGLPNGYQSAADYRRWMLGFGLGLPLILNFAIGSLPRLWPSLVNIPHRDYWLAPERREDSLDFLSHQGQRLALLMLVFLCAVHWQVLLANARDPVWLEPRAFVGSMLSLVLLMTLWVAALFRRFRKPPARPPLRRP